MKRILAALLATLIAGCVDSEPEAGELDGEHDDLDPGGKGDDGGPRYPTKIQAAILRVVNDTTAPDLREAGLGGRAVDALRRHLAGPDGVWPSTDDDFVETFAELDAIPYIGPNAIFALSSYAASHDYVPDDLEVGEWTIALEADPPVQLTIAFVPEWSGRMSFGRSTGPFAVGLPATVHAPHPPELAFELWSLGRVPVPFGGTEIDAVKATGVWRASERRVCGTAHATYYWHDRGDVRFVAVRTGSGVPLTFCD